MADDVLDHDHRAVDDHAEVQRAEREQIGGNVAQIQADGGEQQSEGNGERDDDSAAHIAEEEKQDDDDEDDAFAEVVQHRVGGVVEQVAAIEEGNDLDAGRKDRASLNSATLLWMASRVESELSPLCSRTIPSTTSGLSMSLPSCFDGMACRGYRPARRMDRACGGVGFAIGVAPMRQSCQSGRGGSWDPARRWRCP